MGCSSCNVSWAKHSLAAHRSTALAQRLGAVTSTHVTDQVYQLLIADLSFIVALGQSHQHLQLGGIQGQLMAVHQAGEGLYANETGVVWIKLQKKPESENPRPKGVSSKHWEDGTAAGVDGSFPTPGLLHYSLRSLLLGEAGTAVAVNLWGVEWLGAAPQSSLCYNAWHSHGGRFLKQRISTMGFTNPGNPQPSCSVSLTLPHECSQGSLGHEPRAPETQSRPQNPSTPSLLHSS